MAFGGGIVGDVGGFLAADLHAGIPVMQVPTTLLAQVDAGVGGKTGVNLTAGKNLVGAFHQPLAVLIDPSVLATLPEREYRAGLHEVIKCGVIRSPELFRLMSERQPEVLALAPEVVDRHDLRVGADQGRSRLRRRARGRPAPHPEFRAYLRTRAGSRNRVRALPARRSRGLRDEGRYPPGPADRASGPGGGGDDSRNRRPLRPDPAAGRRIRREPGRAAGEGQEDPWRETSTSFCPKESGRSESSPASIPTAVLAAARAALA